ncbi:MAG: gamma-glutamyltransferase [Proteobacteria bacterium]|nr:gamma-glutamyltransferase [Pseudomonadota bacterium]
MQHGKRPTVASRHGMVAAAHPLAAAAGARILSNGGNAFDAAAATAAALNVVEPYMSGLAGQGLATAYIAKEKRVRSLSFMGAIPHKFPLDKLSKREQLLRGPVAVGAPGNLGGWCEMVSAYGTKKLSELFAPAIKLARDGTALIEFNIEEFKNAGPELGANPALGPAWRSNYIDGIEGGTPKLGAVLKQPDLAKTFETIAAEGPKALYGGALGKKLIDRLQELGGVLTMEDLLDARFEWVDPISADYRGRTVHVPPPPCESFQYLLTLRILEGFDLAKMPRNGVEHIDTVLRAIRLAAGVRIRTGTPSKQKLAELLSDGHVEGLRARVRDKKPITGPTEQWTPDIKEEGHTTSFSIGDAEGNMVCVTQSLGSVFGSGVVVPGTGICCNNFLYWADVTPDSPNRAKIGEIMPVCVAPSIVTQGDKPILALGTPGSYGILQTQPQAFVQYVDYAMPLQQAIEAPRARLTDGRAVTLETRVDPAVHAELRQRGHDLTSGPDWTMKVGGMQGVAIDPATGMYTGGCDPRRDGYVVPAF